MTPFAIFGAHKSGTTTAVAIANTHPRAFCLSEVDFSAPADNSNNAQLIRAFPETAALFGADMPIAEALTAFGEMLTRRGHAFDFVGTKILGPRDDLYAALTCPALFLVRDVRTWATKTRVVMNDIGQDNAAPVIAAYVGAYLRTFLYPKIVRARLEDLLRDHASLPRSVAQLLDLPDASFLEWWKKASWRETFPKSYPNWIKGHVSAFLQPIFTDTKATLAKHPFWDTVLPVFDKYYAGARASFSEAEVRADMITIEAASAHRMTLNEGFEAFQSMKVAQIERVADGRILAKSHEVVSKERGQDWKFQSTSES